MAQPKLKSDEFGPRYNAIDQKRHGEFQLRQLAKDAHMDFIANGNIASGFIAATCNFDLGKTHDALKFFREFLPRIEPEPNDTFAVSAYSNYARMLSYTDSVHEAADVLSQVIKGLPMISLLSTIVGLGIYGKAQRYDDMWALKAAAVKLFPDWEDKLAHPVMFEYYLSKDDADGLVDFFFDIAYSHGFYDVNADNIDKILDICREFIIHPVVQRELNEREQAYLSKARSVMWDYISHEDENDEADIAEAHRRINDPSDSVIPFEQVVKNLGLENIV